jgi:hypothetical protein
MAEVFREIEHVLGGERTRTPRVERTPHEREMGAMKLPRPRARCLRAARLISE